MIVDLPSGDTVEIVVVTQTERMFWAHGSCSGMHVFGNEDCGVCGLYVREPSGEWRPMTSGEKGWLKHRNDWMQYV